jgi:hypothetical protein
VFTVSSVCGRIRDIETVDSSSTCQLDMGTSHHQYNNCLAHIPFLCIYEERSESRSRDRERETETETERERDRERQRVRQREVERETERERQRRERDGD